MKRIIERVALLLVMTLATGCSHFGHYPVNAPLEKYNPEYGYIAQNMGPVGNAEELLLILTFSGGGTRAAAFSYGVLEELKAHGGQPGRQETKALGRGRHHFGCFRREFHGGLFRALRGPHLRGFRAAISEERHPVGTLLECFLNPVNWFRLSSPLFDRSDLAAEYYDENVFDKKTFGDMLERKGPMVLINATDMSLGARFTFHQVVFNAICSDLSKFSVARACAASSAVPGLFTPLTLKNYAGSCGYAMPPGSCRRPLKVIGCVP